MEEIWGELLRKVRKVLCLAEKLEPGALGEGQIVAQARSQIRAILTNLAAIILVPEATEHEIRLSSTPTISPLSSQLQYYLVYADLFVIGEAAAMAYFIFKLESRCLGITERFVVEKNRIRLFSLSSAAVTGSVFKDCGCVLAPGEKLADISLARKPEQIRRLCEQMHSQNDCAVANTDFIISKSSLIVRLTE